MGLALVPTFLVKVLLPRRGKRAKLNLILFGLLFYFAKAVFELRKSAQPLQDLLLFFLLDI